MGNAYLEAGWVWAMLAMCGWSCDLRLVRGEARLPGRGARALLWAAMALALLTPVTGAAMGTRAAPWLFIIWLGAAVRLRWPGKLWKSGADGGMTSTLAACTGGSLVLAWFALAPAQVPLLTRLGQGDHRLAIASLQLLAAGTLATACWGARAIATQGEMVPRTVVGPVMWCVWAGMAFAMLTLVLKGVSPDAALYVTDGCLLVATWLLSWSARIYLAPSRVARGLHRVLSVAVIAMAAVGLVSYYREVAGVPSANDFPWSGWWVVGPLLGVEGIMVMYAAIARSNAAAAAAGDAGTG